MRWLSVEACRASGVQLRFELWHGAGSLSGARWVENPKVVTVPNVCLGHSEHGEDGEVGHASAPVVRS